MSDYLSQKQLESSLWGAVRLLRGLIDANDYKQMRFCYSRCHPNLQQGTKQWFD
jgi:hypothetical protein